ncbi:MAG: hypothetical protein AMXMBFR12_08050 [Candidatus Babeliales bacterium]
MKYVVLFLCSMQFVWALEMPIARVINNNKLPHSFETDGHFISFLDSIRCGIIETIQNNNTATLRFSDYKNQSILYTTSLAQAQTAISYALLFGAANLLEERKIEFLIACKAQEQQKLAHQEYHEESEKYPQLPQRIERLSQEIENLQSSLIAYPQLLNLQLYPSMNFSDDIHLTDSAETLALKTQTAINEFNLLKNNEKYLCRMSIERFYSFWAQDDLNYRQTTKDYQRNLEQIKANRTVFFKALAESDGPTLIATPAAFIIKKNSFTCFKLIEKAITRLQNLDHLKDLGSPHNSDEEIFI